MRIRNLTSDTQALKVIELVGGREFDIYIEGNGCTDIDGMYLRDLNQLGSTFEIVSNVQPSVSEETIPEGSNEEDSQEDLKEESQDDSKEESKEESTTPVSDKFICDVCGAEFASARGLTSHKNRSHLEE